MSPDDAVRCAVESSAQALGHVTQATADLNQARRALSCSLVDLICLDTLFPESELASFWAWLCADGRRADTPLLWLTPASATLAPAALPSFYRSERHALVAKPLERRELARAVAEALAGQARRAAAAKTLRVGVLTLDVLTHRLLSAEGGAVALTPTEARLLGALMERPGEYATPEDLLERVWSYPPGTGGREVVRAHVSNVRRKLRLLGADPLLLRNIPSLGYAMVAEEAAAVASARALART